MSVTNVSPNLGELLSVRPADRSGSTNSSYTGPSFAQSLGGVARAANIQVADGNGAAQLGLRRDRQEKLEKLFSFSEAEEGFIEEAVACIGTLLDLLKK
jgi:hypothetical protein